MWPKLPKPRRRGVVDTSVLVAGIAGFRTDKPATNPSAEFLRAWTEHDTFTWLISAAILDEYVEVLRRCGVHRSLVGKVVNLLREAAEMVAPRRSIEAQPDPGDAPFWERAEAGVADFIVTLNRTDFPQSKLTAKVIGPHEPLPSKTTRPRRPRRR